jgi:hypothetical protein
MISDECKKNKEKQTVSFDLTSKYRSRNKVNFEVTECFLSELPRESDADEQYPAVIEMKIIANNCFFNIQ